MEKNGPSSSTHSDAKRDRQERLAQELRANLRKRKARIRSRKDSGRTESTQKSAGEAD